MRQQTEALIREYYDAFNKNNMSDFLDLLTDDVVHDINQGERETGKVAFSRFMQKMNAHYREQISELTVLSDVDAIKATAEFTVTGTYLKTDEGLPEVARLRIQVFKDYPYLYNGNLEYEKNYLSTYSRSSGSVVVLAIDDDRVVGASTAIPMAHEVKEFTQPLKKAGYDVNRVFYLAESVLLPEYRGKGIGVAFFTHREAHAKAIGEFDHYCFCSVQRPDNHPHRPREYTTLDCFWKRRGYSRQDNLIAHYAWKDIGETEESTKPLMFWMKTAVADVHSAS